MRLWINAALGPRNVDGCWHDKAIARSAIVPAEANAFAERKLGTETLVTKSWYQTVVWAVIRRIHSSIQMHELLFGVFC